MNMIGKTGALVANALFAVWCLSTAAYFLCFAVGLVHWNSFHYVAWGSTAALMAYSTTAPQYGGNRFILENKNRLLAGAFGTIVMVVFVSYLLKGSSYQTMFLGVLLAAASLLVVYLVVQNARRTLKDRV